MLEGFFLPPASLFGINIRVDNRIGKNRLKPDKKRTGWLLCNREMYFKLKNHPALTEYKFV